MQHERKTRQTTYQQYKKTFIDRLNDHHITFTLNGNQELAIDSIVNISFPGTQVETLLMNIDLAHIAASSGSACTAGSLETSYVVSEIFGQHDETSLYSIRFSLLMGMSLELVEVDVDSIAQICKRLNNNR